MLKSFLLRSTLVGMMALCVHQTQAQEYEKTPQGVKAVVQSADISVEFYTPSTVRVLKSPSGRSFEKKSLSVVAQPESVKFSASSRDGKVLLKSDALQVELDLSTGELAFFDKKASSLLKETGVPSFVPVDDAGTPAYQGEAGFYLGAG